MVRKLDGHLKEFSERELEEEFPCLVMDACYEKGRAGWAVQIVIEVDKSIHRRVLGVVLANRESANSRKDFLKSLRERGLRGVEFVEETP